MKTTIYSIHILAAFLAAMFLSACGGSSSTPEGVAKQFFTAFSKQDFKTAAACSSQKMQPMFQNASLMAAMTESMKAELQKKGGIKIIETTLASVSGDTARVNVKTTFGDGTTDPQGSCNMVKENGAWKVDDMR